MAVWTGHTFPKEIFEIRTRRHFWYEIEGTGVNMDDQLEVNTKVALIPILATLSYFAMACDGVVLLNPILSRAPNKPLYSIYTEKTNNVAAVKIANQQPACLILSSGVLVIKPNANADNIDLRISLVLVDGHDSRGI